MNINWSKLMPTSWFVASEKVANQQVDKFIAIANNRTSLVDPLRLSTVYTCIQYRADTLSKLNISIYKKTKNGDTVEATDHYLFPLLKYKPNNFQSTRDIIQFNEQKRLVEGNSLTKINRDNNGFVKNFEILTPLHVNYKVVKGELLFKIDNQDLNYNDILHFRMSITEDGIWGVNPITALQNNLDVTHSAFNTLENAYSNDLLTSKVLESNISSVNQVEQASKLATDWQEKYGGANNAFKTVIVPPFFKLHSMQLNLKDAEFISTIDFNANQIAALYGIPSQLLNLKSNSNANLEDLLINYKLSTIVPTVKHYEDQFSSKLLTEKERIAGYEIKFDLSGLVEADFAKQVEGYTKLAINGIAPRNNVAQIFGFPSFKNGDKHLTQIQNMAAIEDYDEMKDYFRKEPKDNSASINDEEKE